MNFLELLLVRDDRLALESAKIPAIISPIKLEKGKKKKHNDVVYEADGNLITVP